jgi:hypothetical protein
MVYAIAVSFVVSAFFLTFSLVSADSEVHKNPLRHIPPKRCVPCKSGNWRPLRIRELSPEWAYHPKVKNQQQAPVELNPSPQEPLIPDKKIKKIKVSVLSPFWSFG